MAAGGGDTPVSALGIGAVQPGAAFVNLGTSATLVVATGTSQYATLDTLVAASGIAWERVEAFHLDEYVGLPATHPASFRKYLRERFVSICKDPDVQRLTWEAYMNKELARRDPMAHVRIFFKDLAHLAGIVRP